MKYSKLLFVTAFVLFFSLNSSAQCQDNFKFKAIPSAKSNLGKIEVQLTNATGGSYTFKVFRISGEIELIETKQVFSPDKVTFENLKPAEYIVKIEWGSGCSKNIGGLEGIVITEKAEGK